MAALSFTTTSSLTRRLTVLRDTDKTVPSSVVNRPRLTPRTTAARRCREPTESVKPILFYPARACPAARPAFRRPFAGCFPGARRSISPRKSTRNQGNAGVSNFSIVSLNSPEPTRFAKTPPYIITFFRNIRGVRKIFYQQIAVRSIPKGLSVLNLKSKHAPPNPYFFEYGYW